MESAIINKMLDPRVQ